MKANEFFKKFGVREAKIALLYCKSASCGTVFYKNIQVDAEELKCLVKSHELVEQFDDIDCAKAWVSDLDSDWPYQVKGADTKFFKWQLEQAILDVESCM